LKVCGDTPDFLQADQSLTGFTKAIHHQGLHAAGDCSGTQFVLAATLHHCIIESLVGDQGFKNPDTTFVSTVAVFTADCSMETVAE